MPIALAATGAAAAATTLDEPAHTALVHTLTDPTPSVLPSPSPSPSPSTAASASAPTNSNLVAQPPRTNLTAVVDPIAVPVRDGVRIRVGARNSGPLSITAPAGQPAVILSLDIVACCSLIFKVRSLGGCPIGYRYPPDWPTSPEEPRGFDCSSGRTLRVG
ncbi:MAG TPA: hypothetical protein VFC19_44085, partial [Candidatus Limnocylindrales bacterium]|nr:hypothetical protein [Candidatus Limnocylindrales bacterium]